MLQLDEIPTSEGSASPDRGKCFPWQCTQAGREGVLTSKSRGEMLFLSLALLVPHLKGSASLSLLLIISKGINNLMKGSAYASRGKWREHQWDTEEVRAVR